MTKTTRSIRIAPAALRGGRPFMLSLALAVAAACGGVARSVAPDTPRLHRAGAAAASVSVDFTRLAPTGAGRVEEVLQGRVAGLQVLRLPNGSYSLRIRGATTILGSGEPLLVLDGLIVPQELAPGALAVLSPRDVARVEVLKDAGSLAFYGSRGANGVIIVTTRGGLD
jgi:TonB-dependent SusC/RagA subfamily outer membrane receptor